MTRPSATRPFRFGVVATPQGPPEQWLATARRVEQLGYSTLLMPDGLQLLAPFPSLAVAASATTTLRVGHVRAGQPAAAGRARRPGRRTASASSPAVGSSWASAPAGRRCGASPSSSGCRSGRRRAAAAGRGHRGAPARARRRPAHPGAGGRRRTEGARAGRPDRRHRDPGRAAAGRSRRVRRDGRAPARRGRGPGRRDRAGDEPVRGRRRGAAVGARVHRGRRRGADRPPVVDHAARQRRRDGRRAAAAPGPSSACPTSASTPPSSSSSRRWWSAWPGGDGRSRETCSASSPGALRGSDRPGACTAGPRSTARPGPGRAGVAGDGGGARAGGVRAAARDRCRPSPQPRTHHHRGPWTPSVMTSAADGLRQGSGQAAQAGQPAVGEGGGIWATKSSAATRRAQQRYPEHGAVGQCDVVRAERVGELAAGRRVLDPGDLHVRGATATIDVERSSCRRAPAGQADGRLGQARRRHSRARPTRRADRTPPQQVGQQVGDQWPAPVTADPEQLDAQSSAPASPCCTTMVSSSAACRSVGAHRAARIRRPRPGPARPGAGQHVVGRPPAGLPDVQPTAPPCLEPPRYRHPDRRAAEVPQAGGPVPTRRRGRRAVPGLEHRCPSTALVRSTARRAHRWSASGSAASVPARTLARISSGQPEPVDPPPATPDGSAASPARAGVADPQPRRAPPAVHRSSSDQSHARQPRAMRPRHDPGAARRAPPLACPARPRNVIRNGAGQASFRDVRSGGRGRGVR